MDFKSMNLALKRKPTKRIELEVNKKYPILAMMDLDWPNIKSKQQFFCFLPDCYYQYLKEGGVKKIKDMLNQDRPIYILSTEAVSKTHFINESGESVSLTTEDGQPIKVLSMEQQENLKRLIPNGILLPIGNTSQDNGNMLELKDEEPSSVGHVLKSDIQFLNEDYDKLNDDIQFLTEDGGISFVTSYNADESMSAQYL